jgi:transcription antitermination factor NusG
MNWFAVQTRYLCERRVRDGLLAKGLDAYLPEFEVVRQWRDRRKRVMVAAFSGYLFVAMTPSPENRVQVLQTENVVRLLGNAAGPVPVSTEELYLIRQALEMRGQFFHHPFLEAGTMVRVTHGPLTGIVGRFTEFKNGGRLVLSVSSISQSIATEVALADIEPVAETGIFRVA